MADSILRRHYCSDWIDNARLPGSGLLDLIATLSVRFHHPEITAFAHRLQVAIVRFFHDFKESVRRLK